MTTSPMDAADLRRAAERSAVRPIGGPPVIDLRAADPLVSLAVTAAFVTDTGSVLHGSRFHLPAGVASPRPANDAAKADGNRCAVYATTIPAVAVWYAVLDRNRLRAMVGSFRFGYRVDEDGARPWVSDAARDRLAGPDHQGFADGFVYVLDGDTFAAADPLGLEHWSARPVAARWVLRVPAACGPAVMEEPTRERNQPVARQP
jgi:hypothetical protein